MKVFVLVSLFCILHVTYSADEDIRQNHSSAKIVGDYVKMLKNTKIGQNTWIGKHTTIGIKDVSIGSSTKIGNFCRIENGAQVGNNVEIGNSTVIGRNVVIGNSCKLLEFKKLNIQSVLRIDPLLPILAKFKTTTIANDAKIGHGSILEAFSYVGPSSVVQQNVYIGLLADIKSNVTIGKHAIINGRVTVPENARVNKNDIVIMAPSTAELFDGSLTFKRFAKLYSARILNNITDPIAREVNMRQLMQRQMDRLVSNCENITTVDFQDMLQIKTLYLIKQFGIKEFKRIEQALFRLIETMNPSIMTRQTSLTFLAYEKYLGVDNIHNDYHFVSGSPENKLERGFRDQMVQLLALEYDFDRIDRVAGDTFCKLIDDILAGKRKIRLDVEL